MTIRALIMSAMMAGALTLPLGANAQVGPTLKIGAINMQRLMAESPQASAAQEKLQEEFAPRQRDIVAKQNELKEKQEKLRRDLEVMGAEERRNAEIELRKEERELVRLQEEFAEDFNLRRNEELGKLQRELFLKVQTYARESGFDLIVGEGVLFASPTVDITPEVLGTIK